MQIVPPCRVYFYHKGAEGEEYAVFDVDFGESLAGSKYRMQLIDSQVQASEEGIAKHVERINGNPLFSALGHIQRELNGIAEEMTNQGWKVRILPLENTKLSF